MRDRLWAAALSLLICGALWPTLGWVELSNGSEQLVVAAALESQRDGSWQSRVVPTMNAEPRLRKPPLATWSAMLAVSTEEARDLAAGPVNDAAYRRAAVRVRTVALFAGFLLLLGTFELGRLLFGRDVGLAAVAVCGGTFFFVEQAVRLTTDVWLAALVAWANVGIAAALLRGRYWGGLTLAGVALGMAFLTKGPVALLQTVVPALVMLPFLPTSRKIRFNSPVVRPLQRAGPTPAEAGEPPDLTGKRRIAPLVVASALFLGIALPWFLHVRATYPEAAATWAQEVARTDEEVPRSDVFAYVAGLALVVPWTPFVVLGLLTAGAEVLRRTLPRPPRVLRRGRTFGRMRGAGGVYAVLLVMVPILVMTLFRDRKDRYLLPMLPAAASLASAALFMVVADARRRPRGAAAVFAVHWAILLAFCVGMPIAAMFLTRDEYASEFTAWMSPRLAVPLAVGGLVVWAAALWSWRRFGTSGLVAGTTACVIFAANVFLAGYGGAREALADLKPIAEAVRREVPSATVWSAGDRVPPGLLIYAGRPVRPVEEAGDVAGPRVLIVRQRRADRDPEPTMPPPWRVLTVARRDRSLWWAFVHEGDR